VNSISIANVSFAYRDTRRAALRELSLQVAEGQICAVVGRGGAGKSTLCALCAGFIPQFFAGAIRGSAHVDGQDVITTPIAQLTRHVALVTTNPASQISGARFTVFEEVAFGLENIGMPVPEMRSRVEWALGAMGIADLGERSPFALSGGQQQRMVIAAALALKPPVLVLDEPITQLDPHAANNLAALLRSLAGQGTTILVAEHRLDWVAELADQVVALDDGQLIAEGTPAVVFGNPLLAERGIRMLRTQRVTPKPSPTAAVTRAAPLLTLDSVSYNYPGGVAALRNVSLAIGAGEQVAMLGRNGAGKSTLARHLNGLLRPESGQVLVAGQDTRRASVASCARHVGLVFQDVRNQLFARTARDELRFGPRNLRYPPAKIEALVDSALDALGLREVADEHPYDLPYAMRRLVAIAAVVAMDSPVLVLDEPTAGLDTSAVERLVQLCQQRAARGTSTIVITHDLDFAYAALDRVILLDAGTIALDAHWDTLDAAQSALLDASVGLPSGGLGVQPPK